MSRLDKVDPARWAKVLHWKNVGPVGWVNLQSQKNGKLPFQPSQPFVSLVNGPPRFVRKCAKSWLVQGSWGERVTLLPETNVFFMQTLPYHMFISSYNQTSGNALQTASNTCRQQASIYLPTVWFVNMIVSRSFRYKLSDTSYSFEV